MSIEGLGHLFTIYFPGFVCLCFTRPIYQVSVYRTIGPLVMSYDGSIFMTKVSKIDNVLIDYALCHANIKTHISLCILAVRQKYLLFILYLYLLYIQFQYVAEQGLVWVFPGRKP